MRRRRPSGGKGETLPLSLSLYPWLFFSLSLSRTLPTSLSLSRSLTAPVSPVSPSRTLPLSPSLSPSPSLGSWPFSLSPPLSDVREAHARRLRKRPVRTPIASRWKGAGRLEQTARAKGIIRRECAPSDRRAVAAAMEPGPRLRHHTVVGTDPYSSVRVSSLRWFL